MDKITWLTADEMNKVKQPDDVQWPHDSVHTVAFDSMGELSARMSLMSMIHIEGTWVREDRRKGVLAAIVERRTEQKAKELGITSLMAYQWENQPEVGEYLERLGFKRLPFVVWQKGI